MILTAGGDYWHVYMTKKTAGGKNTVKYLDRYLKKPPIAGSQQAHYAGDATLSFRYYDLNTGEQATETLTQREIVARYFGFLANRVWRKAAGSEQRAGDRKTRGSAEGMPRANE